MEQAYLLAEKSKESADLPIGSVVVCYTLNDSGRLVETVVSSGYNTRKRDGFNPLAHAEINALNGVGSQFNGQFRRCVLYTTLEPCPLCYGAALLSRVDGIVYDQSDVGGAISCGLTLHSNYPFHTMFVEKNKHSGLMPVATAYFKKLIPILQSNRIQFIVSGGAVISNRFQKRMSSDIDIHIFSPLEQVKLLCNNLQMTFVGSKQHDRYTIIHRFIYQSSIVDFIEEQDSTFNSALLATCRTEAIEGLLVPTISSENLLITRLMALRKDNAQEDIGTIMTENLDMNYITQMTNHLGLTESLLCISS